jgi:hypothetical protein
MAVKKEAKSTVHFVDIEDLAEALTADHNAIQTTSIGALAARC